MKKIFFQTGGGKNRQLPKSLKPLGCLWRALLFMFLLVLLLLLLSLFRKCCSTSSDDYPRIGGGSGDQGSMPLDESWKRPISNGKDVGLPSPEHNTLPPFENPIPNPENGGATQIYPNLLYVILDSDTDDETFKAFAKKFTSLYPAPAHQIEYYNTEAKTIVLNVPEDQRESICQKLPEEISEVDFLVVPVEVLTAYQSEITPDDPAFKDTDKSWYFKPIQAQPAWSITQGSSDVIVGIVDSYMDLTHPELKGDRCVYPYSVVRGNDNVGPDRNASEESAGHGTLVTAIAVGNANNKEGSSGIAPKCRFIPVSMGESINTVTEVEGLLYCMYKGASVINLSCGVYFPEEITSMDVNNQIDFSEKYGKSQEKMWDYVFDLAEKRNVTIVWAAGNQNCYDAMDVSKRNKNTIRVSSVDKQLRKADFSNFGNFPSRKLYESTISAPGVDIWGALPGNKYDAWQGTSFSAPIITGVVALMKSQNRDLTTRQIIAILQSTGLDVTGTDKIGKIVQIKDALLQAKKTVASGTATSAR